MADRPEKEMLELKMSKGEEAWKQELELRKTDEELKVAIGNLDEEEKKHLHQTMYQTDEMLNNLATKLFNYLDTEIDNDETRVIKKVLGIHQFHGLQFDFILGVLMQLKVVFTAK